MTSAKELSELHGMLYAAPLDPENWQPFFTKLCKSTGADSGYLLQADANGSSGLAGGGESFNPEVIKIYNEYYSSKDPFREPFLRHRRTELIQYQELICRKDLQATEFFNDLLLPHNMHRLTILPCSDTPKNIEFVSLWGGTQAGEMDADGAGILNAILPHLRSALAGRRELTRVQARADRAEAALDRLQAATFLLAGNGRVAHLNKAARILLDTQDGVSLVRGRLTCEDTACQSRVEVLLASAMLAAQANPASPGGATHIKRRSGKSPYRIQLMPLRCSDITGIAACFVLAFVTAPEQTMRLPGTVLRGLYGLSNAETEIVNGLLAGMRLEEIADARQVTLGTIRIQMKSVFGKTGTRRQSDLLRLLLSLPSCV